MQHSWRPDIARAAQGIETCARQGCTAERRPNSGKAGRVRHYVHRTDAGQPWETGDVPRCTGRTMDKRRTRT